MDPPAGSGGEQTNKSITEEEEEAPGNQHKGFSAHFKRKCSENIMMPALKCISNQERNLFEDMKEDLNFPIVMKNGA